MLRTLNILFRVQTSSTVNVLVYYIRKLPLLSKLITTSVYGNHRLKRFIAIFARLIIILGRFLLSIAYVGLLLYVPVIIGGAAEEQQLAQFIHLFVIISFIVASFSNAIILETKRSKYVAIKLLRMSPIRYTKTMLTYKYVMFFICLTTAMLLFGSLLGGSALQLLQLTLAATLWRVLCEYGHLQYFVKTERVLIKQNGIIWTVFFVGFAAAYAPIFLQQTPFTAAMVMHWAVLAIIVAAGLFATFALARYPDYRTIVNAATQKDDPLLNFSQLMVDANKASVASKDSDYAMERTPQHQFRSKQGYAYLNALFFARHRSLIRRPVNTRLQAIGIIGLLGAVLALTIEELAPYATDIGSIIALLPLAMFYISIGEKLCKAMFYHCDLSLLRYRFYRAAAPQHFRIRLFSIMGKNITIAIALCVALTVFYYAAGGTLWQEVLMLALSIIVLSLFFSMHHLLMYYVFQPYTTELNLRNPYFFFVTMIVSGACGAALFIRVPVPTFTVALLSITIIYYVVVWLLVHRFGERTFRIK